MKRALKLIGFLSVAVLLFFIVSSLAFYYLVSVGEVRRFLIEEVERNTDLKVELGAAEMEIGWVTGIVFRDLAMSLPDASQPAITAERIAVRVALLPLLDRQVVFYEVRLQRPVARFVRDKDGRVELLEKLFNLPLLKKRNSELSLDLRTIRVRNGDIEYVDEQPKSDIGNWRLLDAAVDLARLRGQELRDFMRKSSAGQPSEHDDGAALQFNFTSAVMKDDAKINLKAWGHLVFPKEQMDLREAYWSADVEVFDFPAALLREQLSARIPIKSMTGHFGQRIHFEGNPATALQLKSEMELRQVSIDAPELFLTPLGATDGRLSFAADWNPKRLRIPRADLRANDIKFSLQGDIAAMDGKDPHFRLNLSGLSAPIAVLRKYLPLRIVHSVQLENALNAIQAGQVEIKKAGVDATLSQLRRLAHGEFGPQLWFDAELRDFAGTLPAEGSLPLRAVGGQVALANGILTLRDLKGAYGGSRFSDIDGSYT